MLDHRFILPPSDYNERPLRSALVECGQTLGKSVTWRTVRTCEREQRRSPCRPLPIDWRAICVHNHQLWDVGAYRQSAPFDF